MKTIHRPQSLDLAEIQRVFELIQRDSGTPSVKTSPSKPVSSGGVGGGASVPVSSPVTSGMTNPMVNIGDIIYGSTSGSPTRIGIGIGGQFLGISAGIPAWALPTVAWGSIVASAVAQAAPTAGWTGNHGAFATGALTASGNVYGYSFRSATTDTQIDSGTAGGSTNININQGTGGTKFGDGSAGVVASISGAGALTATSIIKSGGTSAQFLKANGSVDSSTYLSSITSGMVTTALGFTPYNATNPSSFIALASAITGYTAGANTALAATDTLLAALGKVQGQITARAASATTISTTAPLTGGGDLSANRTFAMAAATTSVPGYLTSADWNTFNGKQPALSGTGFVKISGTTISYDNSTYALASASVWGGITGASAQAAPAGGWTGNHGAFAVGALTATKAVLSDAILMSGGASQAPGSLCYLASEGIQLWLKNGSSRDFSMYTQSGAFVMYVPTGTNNVVFQNAVSMGALTATTIQGSTYTVAGLPAGSAGMRAFVTNALAPTFG